MKNILLYILTLLVIISPLFSHTDIIVYDENTTDMYCHKDVTEHEEVHHNQEHHQKDCNDLNKSHHHHCSVNIFSLLAVSFLNSIIQFTKESYQTKSINFYQNTFYTLYLKGIFHPPKIY